jgi:hypothetical protein
VRVSDYYLSRGLTIQECSSLSNGLHSPQQLRGPTPKSMNYSSSYEYVWIDRVAHSAMAAIAGTFDINPECCGLGPHMRLV